MSEAPEGDFFGPLNRLGYVGLRAFSAMAIRPYFRMRTDGLENLPAGPFIIAPNHRSHIDPFVLQAAMPSRRLVYVMTRDWYERPLLHPFFRFMRCIALEQDANNRAALEDAMTVLRRGVPLGIFPEGRLVTDEDLGEFNPGVAAIASRCGVPIVPAAILGTREAYPRGARFPKREPVRIRLGEPIDPEAQDSPRRQRLRFLTDTLRERVGALLA